MTPSSTPSHRSLQPIVRVLTTGGTKELRHALRTANTTGQGACLTVTEEGWGSVPEFLEAVERAEKQGDNDALLAAVEDSLTGCGVLIGHPQAWRYSLFREEDGSITREREHQRAPRLEFRLVHTERRSFGPSDR